MVSNHVEENINDAREAINQYPAIGEAAFDLCDGILNNIKGFIHVDKEWEDLFDHEKKVNIEYAKRINIINNELKEKPPMDIYKETKDRYIRARAWRSTEMLNFYDMLAKKYDI